VRTKGCQGLENTEFKSIGIGWLVTLNPKETHNFSDALGVCGISKYIFLNPKETHNFSSALGVCGISKYILKKRNIFFLNRNNMFKKISIYFNNY
jgi:hypothetical protein